MTPPPFEPFEPFDPDELPDLPGPSPLLWPPAARRALQLPSRLGRGNHTLWDDLRAVLLDPAPDPAAAESLHRWLRDQVHADLLAKLASGDQRSRVIWAAQLAPHMLWKLPCSAAKPPVRSHRLIAAVLLPHKLRRLKRELARLAFHSDLHGDPGSD